MNYGKINATLSNVLPERLEDDQQVYSVSIRLKAAPDEATAETLTSLGVRVTGGTVLTGSVKGQNLSALSEMESVALISGAVQLHPLSPGNVGNTPPTRGGFSR